MFSLSVSRSKFAQNTISEHLFCKNFLGGTLSDSHALHVDCVSHNAICSDIVYRPRSQLLYATGFQNCLNRNSYYIPSYKFTIQALYIMLMAKMHVYLYITSSVKIINMYCFLSCTDSSQPGWLHVETYMSVLGL